MRTLHFFLLMAVPASLGASAAVPSATPPAQAALAEAHNEAARADAEVARLERLAGQARTEAQRLNAQQLAAAEAIAAAESRISAADSELRLIALRQAGLKQSLATEQRPVSALLGGLAIMAGRPPLLALAGAQSSEELVRVRILLDSTFPAIQERTAGLRKQLSAGQSLQQAALKARERLRQSRSELASKRQQFAQLEAKALAAASSRSAQAIEAGDTALAAAEAADMLGSNSGQARSAASLARALALEPAPPPGPAAAQPPSRPPFAYALPSTSPVLVGMGTISPSGIRSRGIVLGTSRGMTVAAPAAGTVRFAGPFRDYDGVVIIDHGRGWLSLIVNVASSLRTGQKLALGAPIGRALGPIEVELSDGARKLSPALIAGSSRTLSKRSEDS